MKHFIILLSVLIFFSCSCGDEELPPGEKLWKIVPESRRSADVFRKIKPDIEIQFLSKKFHPGSPIFIRIFKESDELELWVEKGAGFELFKIYEICYYSGDLGPKFKSGDDQAPEGFYFVPPSGMNPSSSFHLSFNIGYPNKYDRHYKRTGSYIMVHGSCVSSGCFAMTDKNIEEIFTIAAMALEDGQPFFRVHIFPFRMTKENMEKYKNSPWISFWKNLKEGFDYFEEKKLPPDVGVKNGNYTFK